MSDEQPYLPSAAHGAETGHLLREGIVRPLVGGVVVAAHVPDTRAVRAAAVRVALRAAQTWTGAEIRADPQSPRQAAEDLIIGHASAAWLYASGPPPTELDVVLPTRVHRPRRRAVRYHEHRLGPGEVIDVEGLRVTAPLRTAADLARELPLEAALDVLDALRAECQIQPLGVLAQLERMRRARGVGVARGTITVWAARTAATAPPHPSRWSRAVSGGDP